LFDHICE